MTRSTKDRIVEAIEAQPSDSEGWRAYDLSQLYDRLPDVKRGNIQVQLSEMLKGGRLEGRKSGRNWTHVKLAAGNDSQYSVEEILNGSKSQTERLLHYLYESADERGNVPEVISESSNLQRTLKIRDIHDVNKAIRNLNKLGILNYKETRVEGRNTLVHLQLRLDRKKSWPIDMLSDDELPGQTEPEEVTDVIPLDASAMEDLVEATTDEYDTEVGPTTRQVADSRFLEHESLGGTSETSFTEEFPGIAEAVRRHLKRTQAVRLLDEAGDTEISELIVDKVKDEDPLMKELVRMAARMGFYG